MEFLSTLWLPIVLSTVFVFIVSSILHMVLPFHKSDFRKLANEEQIMQAMRQHGVQPGQYAMPMSSMKEMSSAEMLKKYEEGPVAYLTVLPNRAPAIGKSLVQWFLYSLVISAFTAYLVSITVAPGAEYLQVFRVAGTMAVIVYAANVHESIWKGVSWGVTLKFVFDGILYGLVTAGTFAWLWPKA